jgi:hypothetical protein
MASITTYDTLVQALKDAAEDDGTEFANYIPVAVDLAEERLFRELDLPEIELKASGTLTTNVTLLAKPSSYEFGSYLAVGSGSSRTILKKKLESFILDYWPDAGQVGFPKYYADYDDDYFILAPTPETNYAYELKYSRKESKLGSSKSTNYYTNNCKDLLFAASMIEMLKFMKAFNQLAVWEQKYRELQESWNVQMMRYRRDGQIQPMSPDDNPNTLKHTITSNA